MVRKVIEWGNEDYHNNVVIRVKNDKNLSLDEDLSYCARNLAFDISMVRKCVNSLSVKSIFFVFYNHSIDAVCDYGR